ncbi:DUF305 domain-containing protein [Kineococcus rhizosphaerae]|uniref:Uncharacterized protein (DUF305 family) n=1 Tax=Kineococcus rhizosphaerae TaxID=559628 RepID=A0A2T0R622_9ACTN|nr:DUF305 domain-containing protein [Kineococcus rhizosphaerae]PRY16578.1 uncharacterized protein (DUF305 family) [Kineococcus rhizosphaerae]
MRTTTPTTRAARTTRPAARPLARVVALGAAATLSLVLAACGGDDAGSMDHSSMASESSTTSASPSAGATSSVDAEHDDQDVMFAQMMIVHHQGAVEMAQMATTQASSQQVEDLAAEIEAAQRPEIEEMTSWLNAWGAPATAAPSMTPMTGGTAGGVEGMDRSSTSGMPGMTSEEQMTQLQNATGTDFDRVFLQLMIEHHTGAVQMAQTEQQRGSNPQAQELADSIVTSQSGEIEQMKQMLTALG